MNLKITLISIAILFFGFATAGNVVYTIDISKLTNDEVFAVLVLEGLANRESPQILIEPMNKGGFQGGGYKVQAKTLQRDGLVAIAPEVLAKYESLESVWIEYYTNTFGYTFQRVSFTELFSMFSTKFKGIVLYDGNRRDINIPLATTIAGVKDAIPVTTSLLTKYPSLQIDTVENLVVRNFPSTLMANKWLIDNYLNLTNKDFAYSYWKIQNNIYTVDIAVSKKLFAFNLSFASEQIHTDNGVSYPYSSYESSLLDKIFAHLNPGSLILGWGEPNEVLLQARCGSGGHALLACTTSPNFSFHAAVPVTNTTLKQKRQLTANDVTLENKIYIAFSDHDGDSYRSVGNLMNDGDWLHQKRGSIPFNWPTNPQLFKILPALANYYYGSMTDNDYFYSPTSGIGYFDAWYSTPDQRVVYAQKAKQATSDFDMHYIDVWWNGFVGNDQWIKDMGMLGYTTPTQTQRVDFSKVLPVIETDIFYDLYWPPTERQSSGMAKYIREQTKNVINRPWFTNVYGCDPTFAAAVMANLDSTRFKAVCMDEFFLLAIKAKTKLLGRFINKDVNLHAQIIFDSSDDIRFVDEFSVPTLWNNVFCQNSIENGEMTITGSGDNNYTVTSKGNLTFDLNKYPILAVKINQYPMNGANWKITMYDGSTNVNLPGTSAYKVENQDIYCWDITKISSWSGKKISNAQFVMIASSELLLQDNTMKCDWIRSYETKDNLLSDISNSEVLNISSDKYQLIKDNSQLIVNGVETVSSLKLYSVNGILQRESNTNRISINDVASGIYIVVINQTIQKKININ